MNNGYFGSFGGLFIPETLSYALRELDELYNSTKDDVSFRTELEELYKNYVGRPSPLYFAEKYNYSKAEVTKIHQVHDEHILHNASLTSNKKSGRQHYKPFRRPILRNFVYFVSSQSHVARKFFNLFRKI